MRALQRASRAHPSHRSRCSRAYQGDSSTVAVSTHACGPASECVSESPDVVRAEVGDDDVEQEPAREQAGDGVCDHLRRCERYRVEDAEEVRLVTQHLMTFG